MNPTGIEIETKFHVRDLQEIESRLQALEARLVQPRQYERNLRFDLPDGSLRKTYRVLRLRQDEKVVLTYKGPGSDAVDGIRAREEREVVVSDFATMRKILESLGYGIQFIYEKYRTTYIHENTHVMLDEMPFGFFIEIEGETQSAVMTLAEHLKLDKEGAIPDSYQVLFERVKDALGLSFRDLTFSNFSGIDVPDSVLGVKRSD
jgi:adenylate cyclase, class 2